jgi:hypothetical protein
MRRNMRPVRKRRDTIGDQLHAFCDRRRADAHGSVTECNMRDMVVKWT